MGSPRISAGVPSAMTPPWCITVMRSARLHHDPHIVLDDEERDVALARERANGCDRSVRLGLAHAGDRLVEQQQLRPTASARARSTRFWMPNGRSRTGAAASGARSKASSSAAASRRASCFDPTRAAEADDRGGDAINMMAVKTGQHVIEHGLVAKQFHMLERAPDAARGDDVGRERGDLPARRKRSRRCAGRTMPVIALISEVLPAPLGPIRPRISPASMRMVTPRTAATPPKLTETLSSSRRLMAAAPCRWRRRPHSDASEPTIPFGARIKRAEQDHAVDDVAIFLHAAQRLGQKRQHGRADDRTPAPSRGRQRR